MAAVIDAISSGITDTVVRSSISTSSVKSMPAIGALNIPAMPAAAPQPTRIISVRGDIRNHEPTFEPMAAPVYTIGPSAPTEPPKPMVIDEATMEVYMLCLLRRLLFCDMAYSTRVTPCEILCRTA